MESIRKVCEKLKENSYYAVTAILYKNNVAHKAIIYTGFKNGSYRKIMNAAYQKDIRTMADEKIQVEVLGELELLN